MRECWKKKRMLSNLWNYIFYNRYLYKSLYDDYKWDFDSLKKKIKYADKKAARKWWIKTRFACLCFKCSISNVFWTLTDLKGKVIYTITPGQISDKNNKRYKLSSHLVEKIVKNKLLPLLKKFKLSKLFVISKGRAPRYLKSIKYFLRKNRIFINHVLFIPKRAHHFGRRKRKKRRL